MKKKEFELLFVDHQKILIDKFGTFVRTTSRMSDFDGAPDIVTREIVMNEPPLWASWMVLALICMICLALLSRKVKAYEVIK